MDSSKAKSLPNPRAKANIISVLFWSWTLPLFKKGYTKTLAVDDLFDPLKKDHSALLGDRLERQWERQLKRAEKRKAQPNLLKTIFLTFRKEILLLALLHITLEFVVKLVAPIALGWLLQYFKPETTSTLEDGLMYAGILSLFSLLHITSANQYLYLSYYLGGKIRISLCSLVYRKALKLSKTALGETAPGQIVNLVANDVNRFDQVVILMYFILSAPLITLVVGYILYFEVRYAALIGIAVVLTVVPIQVYAGKLSSDYRLQTALKTDERIRLMDEIISGVQVIKMYAWEKPFCALVELARRLELKVIKKSSYLRGIYMTFMIFTTRMAMYCTLIAMLMFDEPLSADKIFVLASFYNVVSQVMSAFFARGVAEMAECKVSVNRIQSFLMLDEFREGNVENMKDSQDSHDRRDSMLIKEMEKAINLKYCESKRAKGTMQEFENKFDSISEDPLSVELDDVTVKWSPDLSDNTLEDINLKLEKGKLYAVIGMVGSGKSSFLSAILGEVNLEKGNIRTHGKVSYVDQETWVFGSSVRQNILFGQEFDRQRYQKVVKACSLFKDFAQFPEGDHTMVGERGSSLSGGQKARINLARAVYREADIYLLDDPLSAVDAHVGKHLFEECIKRYLRGKTRILATHQLQYVKEVDGIILLDQGKMQYYENYHRLLETYPEYNCLIAEEKEENSNEDISFDNIELRRRFSSIGSRRISASGDVEFEEVNDDARNIEDVIESSSKGIVKGSIFLKYFQAGSSWFSAFIVCSLFVVTQIFASVNDYIFPYIVTVEESRRYYDSVDNDTVPSNSLTILPKVNIYPREYYIYFYTAIVLSILFFGLLRSFIYFKVCLRSNEKLHNSAFGAIIRSSMRFFDTNPSGRILNRFSKDTLAIDDLLPKALLDATQALLAIAGALIITCSINPIFIVPAAIVGVVCYGIRHVFLKTSTNIKRLEGMTRSPVFTHLNATLNGIATIRAYQAQGILKEEFDKFQDLHTSSWFMFIATTMAYAFFLDFFSLIFITFIIFSFFFFKDEFSGSQVGLAITQMMSITGLVQWGMRQSAEVTNQMMSVERILEYTQLPPENNLRDQVDNRRKKKKKKLALKSSLIDPPKEWPNNGTVEFSNVFMRYAEEDDPVLRNLSFLLDSTEKVGIVGRTGAGKSSLIAALFRLAKIDGSIKIDGIDTGTIPVEDLRSRISIIPQDPVLFSGTLRRNLDPFKEFPDTALWEALGEVELKDAISATGNGLDCRVLDRGSNFSVGQRQLVCLARAILRNNKVLMLDEATANVDPQTDALIQQTIRTKFAACTVLTVAHRLNTIIDSDKVIVMDKGQLVEFDHPFVLLERENSQFTSLVKETGDAMFEQLFATAKQCYEDKIRSQIKVLSESSSDI